jgi:hypothetical protein
MELSSIIEKALWFYEWNFPVSQNRLAGFASGTFRYHRKVLLGLRVNLSGIIEESAGFESDFLVSEKKTVGYMTGTFRYRRIGSLGLRGELSDITEKSYWVFDWNFPVS